MMSSVVWFILVGLIAGWIAGQYIKGGGFGILGDIGAGVVGAVIGGLLFRAMDVSTGGGLLGDLTAATIGAVVLLLIIRQLRRA